MLILTRKDGEELVFGTSDGLVRVQVWRKGQTTRIGIDAPDAVKIFRAELVNGQWPPQPAPKKTQA